MDGPRIIRKIRGASYDPAKKYDEILRHQEELGEHIDDIGHEGYQRLFVPKNKKISGGSWVMIGVIIVATLVLIDSLPIDWGLLFPLE